MGKKIAVTVVKTDMWPPGYYACYDGKLGRATPAKIIKRRGCFNLFEFALYEKEKPLVQEWFANNSSGKYVVYDDALMPRLFGIKRCPGDWYGIIKIRAARSTGRGNKSK